MPRLPMGDAWALYGTFGLMRWEIDPDSNPLGQIARDRDTVFLYGAGVGSRFPNGIGVGVEYQRADGDYEAMRLNISYGL
jgi:hypothetical protein